MKKILFLIAMIALTAGCAKDGRMVPGPSKYFVQTYFIANEMHLGGLGQNKLSFALIINGKLVGQADRYDPEKFQKLSQKYNDQSFNKPIATPYYNNALGNAITTFEITSDADYDATHPAGSSLTDIVWFDGRSFYPFIKSGYNDDVSTFLNKPVNQLTTDELALLEVYWNRDDEAQLNFFYFSTPPTLSLQHNITVTITDADNNVFTAVSDGSFVFQ
jgi:hypothetical protein